MTREKPYVLITGATSGMGYALAQNFSSNKYPVILVSRNQEKLDKCADSLRTKSDAQIVTVAQDLLNENAAYNIFARTQELNLNVGILINNAGFNEVGLFTDTDLQKEQNLIRIHISVVMELTKLYLPGMLQSKYGRVVNLGSTGSFMPVPNNAIYCTAKVFVKYFSEAIRHELRNTGVKVTCLCPGATHTNFHLEAEISDIRLFNIFPMKPEKVVSYAYKRILKGKKVVIPSCYNKIVAFSPKITPPFLLNRMTDWMYGSVNKPAIV